MKKNISHRIESDTLGKVAIQIEHFWGPQTERAIKHFQFSNEKMPKEIIIALAIIKKAAATVNLNLKILTSNKKKLIIQAANEIIAGKLDRHFPLSIWQSGSGTQTNMNVNEVIAYFANKKGKEKIHPNDHVNLSQSTNDVFPSSMHISSLLLIDHELLPTLKKLAKTLAEQQKKFSKIIKIGRTHLQDALPLTLGQEFSSYLEQISFNIKSLENASENLRFLAIGGTAVGNGLNAPKNFDRLMCKIISKLTKTKFFPAKNKFTALASHEAIVLVSGVLQNLATSLFKIANDLRWLGSGPNCGLGELIFPENEPGSSIMPAKINPTQCESLMMVCAQVIGNHHTIVFANSQGNLELNVFKPVIIDNFLRSIKILNQAINNFDHYLLPKLKVNKSKIAKYCEKSLMWATLLSPVIGYDKTAEVIKKAAKENISWSDAVFSLGYMSRKNFNNLMEKKKKEIIRS
jgi:fumarate hydratase, class II